MRPRLLLLLAVTAASTVSLPATASARSTGPDLDRDGLADKLEHAIGLSPTTRDRVGFVDDRFGGKRCSDDSGTLGIRAMKRPWCSLKSAVEAVPAGGVVLVRRGTYSRTVLARAGAGRVRVRPFPGERVVLGGLEFAGGGVRVEGFRITGSVTIDGGVSGVALVANQIVTADPAAGTNISIQAGARRLLIADNRIAQRPSVTNTNAINFNSTNTLPAISDVTLRNNKIGPVKAGDAIQAKHTRNLRLEGNEIFGITLPQGSSSHPDAFQSIFGATNLTLKGNFIHDIAAQGIAVQTFQAENRNVTAQDNVITRVAYPFTAFGIDATGTRIDHNTIDGLLLLGKYTRNARVTANIAAAGLIPDPNTQMREDYNLAKRFIGAPGPHSLTSAPAYRDLARNDLSLAPSSPGYQAGPDGESIGARRPTFPPP